jgi:hypothetical protein
MGTLLWTAQTAADVDQRRGGGMSDDWRERAERDGINDEELRRLY